MDRGPPSPAARRAEKLILSSACHPQKVIQNDAEHWKKIPNAFRVPWQGLPTRRADSENQLPPESDFNFCV